MTDWKEYSGSDEQIAEIESAFLKGGFIVTNENGSISEVIQGTQQLSKDFVLYNFEQVWGVKRYLICKPHPLADMICRWAKTGQPVWCRYMLNTDRNPEILQVYETDEPDWNIEGAEYSFTEFKDK